ncbi:hypothetical protein A6A05_08960 [Magnetospirillum moscoviense]|uniref:Uncharacterized protein n=1 Tax=Magnetospirillum moscoviense TaxID=1437059 RepID=A0A178MVQ6_9PROT|nr:hypothetical protein A6A05_08960 [Magnetospirillum moscoviense]
MLDLVGDDGEALARFARTGGFNRGVQGQHAGLGGDPLNQTDHMADGLNRRRQSLHAVGGLADLADRLAGDVVGGADLLSDFIDGEW